jgi:hypothetical protein
VVAVVALVAQALQSQQAAVVAGCLRPALAAALLLQALLLAQAHFFRSLVNLAELPSLDLILQLLAVVVEVAEVRLLE